MICPVCHGTGTVWRDVWHPVHEHTTEHTTCPRCDGTGEVPDKEEANDGA
jgi:DnaJ-class molecular chaperone